MKENKLLSKDFSLVVIGQIISLFGNNMLRFALPLYLLNKTHSASLFGIVSACSFIPMIILSPIGGIIADRINKRNIMVILDFCTAILTLIYTLFLGKVSLITLTFVTLIILYGIQGTYQPSVQASIPVLVSREKIVSANSIVSLVNSLANLLGPVLGGIVYGFYGINIVLIISMICFCISAVMEIFINIPFIKKPSNGNIFSIAKSDLKDGMSFMKNKQPVIWKVTIFVAAINFFFTALLIIGIPVIITQKLEFNVNEGNRLYGYCQGAMATGGIIGGLISATLSKKFNINKSYIFLLLCPVLLCPIPIALFFNFSPMTSYYFIVSSCFLTIISSTIFSIEMISYLQLITPSELIGKIMSLTMCICMIANPLGQAIYGELLEIFIDRIYLVFFFTILISLIIAVVSKKVFKKIPNSFESNQSQNDTTKANVINA